jgi:hypothetical protein
VSVTVKISGLEVGVELRNMGTRAKAAALVGVIRALQVGKAKTVALLSADDHSLAELAAMGHPYSKVHGFVIHVPDETVHTRGGELVDGVTAVPPKGTASSIIEGSIVNTAQPLDRWIQAGTIHMRARPYMDYVTKKYGDDMAAEVTKAIDAALARPATGGTYTGAILSKYRA